MAYNNLNTYNFKISIDQDLDQNEILYLKDNTELNSTIKNNSKFILNNNSTFQLKNNISNEIQISGKISVKENIKLESNINLEYLSLSNIFSLTYLQNLNKININTNLKDFNFLSNELNFSSSNYLKSNEITGQLIYNLSGKQNLIGKNGVSIDVKEVNGKKYFEVESTAYKQSSSNSLTQSINKFKALMPDSNFNSKDENNQYQFISQVQSSQITASDPPMNAAIKSSHYIRVNNTCKLWDIGRTYILIDTTEIDSTDTDSYKIAVLGAQKEANLGKSRYQMFIDLTNRIWKNQDEITFFIKNSNTLSNFEYNNKIYSFNKKYYTGYGVNPGVNSGLLPPPPPNIASAGTINTKATMKENIWYSIDLTANNTNIINPIYSCLSDHTFLNKSIDNYFILENDSNTATKSATTLVSGSAGVNSTYPAGSIGSLGKNLSSWAYKLPANTSPLVITKFIDMTSTETFQNFIRREWIPKNGMTYYYQYVIKFPTNTLLFLDNNHSESSNFLLTRAIDNFKVTWDSNKTPYNQTYNIVYGNSNIDQMLAAGILVDNCLIFNISPETDNISFTLKYIGNEDPSRPNMNIWTIN